MTDATNPPQPQAPAQPDVQIPDPQAPDPQAPDPTATAPAAPAPLTAPVAADRGAAEDPVMAKLGSAAALATALAQNPEVLKFMTALVGDGKTAP